MPTWYYVPAMTACDILIDTNLVLHFRPIDQVDWRSLTGFDRCTLVITPILLRELEQRMIGRFVAQVRTRECPSFFLQSALG